MDTRAHYEQHEFHCEPCDFHWQVSYEVRDLAIADASSKQYFYLTGLPASSPLEGRRCPNCWEPTRSSQLIDGDLAARGR